MWIRVFWSVFLLAAVIWAAENYWKLVVEILLSRQRLYRPETFLRVGFEENVTVFCDILEATVLGPADTQNCSHVKKNMTIR